MATTIDGDTAQVDGQDGGVATDSVKDEIQKRSTRRQLLRLAGAAALGAAGAAALDAVPASANDGDPVVTGGLTFETEGFATEIIQLVTGSTVWIGSTETAGTGFYAGVGDYGTGFYGQVFETYGSGGVGVRGASGAFGYGVAGTAYGSYGVGVSGRSSYVGVFGEGTSLGVKGVAPVSNNYGYGVFGVSYGAYGVGVAGLGNTGVFAHSNATFGYGVYARSNATTSSAVYAVSDYGLGVFAEGSLGALALGTGAGQPALEAWSLGGGPDVALGYTGRLTQVANISGGAGAPNFVLGGDDHEIVRDTTDGIWATSGVGSGQAAWKRINAVRVDTADGTGGVYQPFRVKDTRGGPRPAKSSFTTVTIAGTGTGAQTIPANAIAVVGNLTATSWSGPGYLSIVPWSASPTAPTTSTVNFGGGAQSAIANSFIIGLNQGKVNVFAGAAACHFIIDITGYIQ